MKMLLTEIVKKLPITTDKEVLGYIEEFYNTLFSPIKDDVKSVLEIGILQGGSILLWQEYFTNAKITCMDINLSEYLFTAKRVKQLKCNAYTQEGQNKLQGEKFDIIIDDGPHDPISQKYFIKEYFKYLKKME